MLNLLSAPVAGAAFALGPDRAPFGAGPGDFGVAGVRDEIPLVADVRGVAGMLGVHRSWAVDGGASLRLPPVTLRRPTVTLGPSPVTLRLPLAGQPGAIAVTAAAGGCVGRNSPLGDAGPTRDCRWLGADHRGSGRAPPARISSRSIGR